MRGGALILLLPLAACASAPLEQRAWLEVRSPNFTLYSNLPQAQAVALTEDLEVFRAVAGKLMGATHLDPRVPTRIFAFARAEEVGPFAPAAGAAGFFRPARRAACWSHGQAREEADKVLAELDAGASAPAAAP